MDEPVGGARREAPRTAAPELLATVRDGVATLTLNRPAALNALSFAMLEGIARHLEAWESDARVRSIVLRGAGEKAFCAGGDVRAVREALVSGGDVAEFFRVEYALDHRVHTYGKPIVALMDGIVMGGGMGLAQGARLRIVGDRTRMAMPETAIGLFPDVGGSWFLGRAPGGVGLYLGLVGTTIGAADALHAGLADLYVPSGAIGELEAWLAREGFDADAIARRFGATPPPGELAALRPAIDRHFAGESALAILESLTAEADPRWRDWARRAAAALRRRSPTMLEVTREQLRRGASLALADCFRMEYNLIHGCFEHGDMAEGIRALLVDKDHTPRWRPATLEEVTPAAVAAFFVPRWEAALHPLASLGARSPVT